MARYTFKKPEKYVLFFLIMLCVGLLLLILYVQGKTVGLQNLLKRHTNNTHVETKEEEIKPVTLPYTATIRVAITDGEGKVYRDEVRIHSDLGMRVDSENATEDIAAGAEYAYTGGQTLRIEPVEGGRLYIGDVDYEGILELRETSQGKAVVNEINLEHYLKRVVPSEMPASFGLEALKAQAVCARTYAYAHSNQYAYEDLQAQMDDTVSFQVYNHCKETNITNQAVVETAGQILRHGDEVISTLYYSTSCGYAQDGSIFGDKVDLSVFPMKYIGVEEQKMDIDTYLRQKDESAYECNEKYFRWTAQIPEKNAMGKLKEMTVLERNPGGAVTKMELKVSKKKKQVVNQLEIRKLLGGITSQVILQNGEALSNVTTLPSACFSIEKQADGSFLLYGGGFGHGVGMSQNGAKALAAIGYGYRDILQYFYQGVTLSGI